MTSTTNTLIALVTTVSAFAFSAPSQATISPQIETALVSVCQAAKSNKLHKFNSTKKSHRLNSKTIAMKVSCNGQDIIAFAQTHGAHKVANHLDKSVDDMSTSELASVKRINVNFEG